jgi:hypothetical protein
MSILLEDSTALGQPGAKPRGSAGKPELAGNVVRLGGHHTAEDNPADPDNGSFHEFAAEEMPFGQDLGVARGIANAAVLSVPLWALIGAAGYFVLH